MIAIRRLGKDRKPSELVEIVETTVGSLLIRAGKAQPANGPTPAAPSPDELPHVDENLEVIGLTDADPDFFDKQREREEAAERDKGLGGVGTVMDRMIRGARRKEA